MCMCGVCRDAVGDRCVCVCVVCVGMQWVTGVCVCVVCVGMGESVTGKNNCYDPLSNLTYCLGTMVT